jgi:hypothetical protein
MINPVTIDSNDVIWIGGDLHCKTPEALKIALEQIGSAGYAVDDSRKSEHRLRENVSVEQMEQKGWSLWYAHLTDIRKGKCNSCDSLISTRGIQMHGHKCEKCGEVTYLEITDDSLVKFRFKRDDDQVFGPVVRMKAKRYEIEEGWLYLKREFDEYGGFNVVSGEEAEDYLALHADKWELVEEDGEQLVKIRYVHRVLICEGDVDVIEMHEISGHYWNHSIVKVWDGVEYPEWDRDFPMWESFSVFEAWHWAPLEPSPTLHRRVLQAVHNTDDKGWHYQDGRPWFKPETFKEMGKFVRHFTTLDADAWDAQSQLFRLDGPGGIDDVAEFCHLDAVVQNKPNIGSFLTAVTGDDRSTGNLVNAAYALAEDEAAQELVKGLTTPRKQVEPLTGKIPRKLKKALHKPLSRRTARERGRVRSFLTAARR